MAEVWIACCVIARGIWLASRPASQKALVVPALEAKRVRPCRPGLALVVEQHKLTALRDGLSVRRLQNAAIQPVCGTERDNT